MLDKNDVLSTVQMIDRQHLDIRTNSVRRRR